jgi:antitoxin component YwqK of YwqJK toxin-antitoxin module
MKIAVFTVPVLLAALGVGCAHHANPPSPGLPAEEIELVEEYWPDGSLKLRKQVLRLEDGTVADHGSFERWHKNGAKEYEAFFVRGKKDGTATRFHVNGQAWTRREYRNGKRHGSSITWDASGVKVKEEGWYDGRPHGTWTVWRDGRIEWSHTFDHGAPAP